MGHVRLPGLRPLVLLGSLALYACGGGGGGGSSSPGVSSDPDPTPAPPPAPTPLTFTDTEAARFLSQATFGPGDEEVKQLVDMGPEEWFMDQLDKPANLHLDNVLAGFPEDGSFFDENGQPIPGLILLPSYSLWEAMIAGEDQLRQRMAFALSQILVVSGDSNLGRAPQTLAHYADILTENAFGNYRDLLEQVTYSPAMSIYLTYLRNEKADPETGRVPDENYARELLQLFTVGLVELNPDGTPVQNPDGSQVELYDNDDITELAKVFTGLSWNGTSFTTPLARVPLEAFYTPLGMFNQFHSDLPKNFLGANIPANTGGINSIDMALDAIFGHPNVGPFIGRQLIQRFVTSAPTPDYVRRVADTFDRGSYDLPGGDSVGSGQRGDLSAVLAAILFDDEARDLARMDDPTFGKLREPVLRFTHWARAFDINSADPSGQVLLRNTSLPDALGQHPYLSPSVFNFYRPGYVAAGTETGDAGLTAPELQITNASSIVGYPNFLSAFSFGFAPTAGQTSSFVPDYGPEMDLANDPAALLDRLDGFLTHGTMQAETRNRITNLLNALPEENRELRAQAAAVLVMTSPEYIVQR